MHSNSTLQLPIAWAFDSTSSRQDHGDPWGREHGPLRQCLAWTSSLEVDTWQKDCCDVNLKAYQLPVSSTTCKCPLRRYDTNTTHIILTQKKFCIGTEKKKSQSICIKDAWVKIIKPATVFVSGEMTLVRLMLRLVLWLLLFDLLLH